MKWITRISGAVQRYDGIFICDVNNGYIFFYVKIEDVTLALFVLSEFLWFKKAKILIDYYNNLNNIQIIALNNTLNVQIFQRSNRM